MIWFVIIYESTILVDEIISKMLKWIVAMDQDRVIWKDGKMPWHEPEDLKRFKQLTQWQICLMWRKTYEWLKQYRPDAEWYPHASKNLIFSRSMPETPWVEVIHNIKELQEKYGNEIVRVLWWAKTFEILMPYIDEIYFTLVPGKHEWDTYMPETDLGYVEYQWKTKSWLEFIKYTRAKDAESRKIISWYKNKSSSK